MRTNFMQLRGANLPNEVILIGELIKIGGRQATLPYKRTLEYHCSLPGVIFTEYLDVLQNFQQNSLIGLTKV